MGRSFEIPEPRNRHLVVVESRPRVSPRHPSLRAQLFDWEDPDLADENGRYLTNREIQVIAGVLRHARGHCPSPKALDDAIELLTGKQ
jgi:hypothetical protein